MAKRIYLLDIYEKDISGFTTYKQELFSCLKGYEDFSAYHIVLNFPTDEFFIDSKEGVITFYIPEIYGDNNVYTITALLKLYILNSPDNIFIQNFAPAYPLLKILRETFPLCKIIYVIHDFMWATYLMGDVEYFKKIIAGEMSCKNDSLIFKLYKDGLNSFAISDKIICLSDDTCKLLVGTYFIAPSKIRLIPNGLKDSYVKYNPNIRQQYNIQKDDKVILFVGRICQQKGALDLLAAFKSIVSIIPNCWLMIAGSIDNTSISVIEDCVRTHILILGVLSKERLYELYQMADIGIVSSYYEQCSYTGIEMQMFGLPIVASNSFGVRCMFNETNAMIYKIHQDNPKSTIVELSSKITDMLKQPKVDIDTFKKASRFQYESTYTHDKMSIEYKQMFLSLL